MTSSNIHDEAAFQNAVERAGRMTPEERLLECLRLSDRAAEDRRERLREEMPQASEEEINRELCVRYDEIRRATLLGFTVIDGHLMMRGDRFTSAPPETAASARRALSDRCQRRW